MPKQTAHETRASWLDGVAMLAVYCVAAPFATMPFAYFPRANAPVRLLAALLFLAAGWGLQGLICRLLRYERPKEGGGYEKGQKYYHVGLAIPVWLAAAAVLFLLPRAADRWLYYIAANSTDYLYDSASVFPGTAGFAAAVLMLLGSATRLFPYTRVLAMRACMTYIALFLISFMLGGGGVSAFCLLIFAVCAALLLNQSSLDRERRTLSLPEISRDTRMGGVTAVLWLVGVFLGVSAVMCVLVGGGMMVGRVLLFMLIKDALADENGTPLQYSSTDEVMNTLNRMLVQGDENPMLNYVLMILFLLGVVAAVLVFALRHNEAVCRWLRALWNRIAAFIDWLFGASTRLYYRAHSDGDEVSYRDERKRLKPVDHRAVIGADAAGMSWREFRSRLAACPGDEAKLTYAYAVLAAVLRAQPQFPLLRADTPRRIEQKVRARGRHDELREITAVYETINYAERSPDPAEVSRALALTCGILQEYFA